MQIIGIGIDITNTNRFIKLIHNSNFITKILTPTEQILLQQSKSPLNYMAKRWAGKEAYFKAIGKMIGWQNVEITNHPTGQPTISSILYPNISSLISLSDEKEHAIAMVILLNSIHTQTPPL